MLLLGSSSHAGWGQAADLSVAKPVEGQFDQFPAGGDLADVGSAPRADLVTDLPEPGVATDALNSLHRGHAHQPAALLGNLIGPRCTVVSDSWCFGVNQAQLRSPAKARHVADLGDEHAARIGPHPGMAWIAAVPRSRSAPNWLNTSDLKVQPLDHAAGRVDLSPSRRYQRNPVQQRLPADAEQIAHHHRHPGTGQHRMHLALHTRTQRH